MFRRFAGGAWPTEADRVKAGGEASVVARRAGVEGRELARAVGVQGLGFCGCLGLSGLEGSVGRVFAGAECREIAVERLLEKEGLEVTEAVLVLRIAVLLLFERHVEDERVVDKADVAVELLLVGLAEVFFSD